MNREGLSTTLRLELRDLLTPKLILRKPFRWDEENVNEDEPNGLRQLVEWELVLTADHMYSEMHNLNDDHWTSALPHLLEDFQQLLHDALDLLRELGEADDRSDPSYVALPSITPHWQNREICDWVVLIELIRDAWLVLRSNDSLCATKLAQHWFELPYPTFKRLALFAASQDGIIPSAQWVDWLLSDDAYWLWSHYLHRETMRLLALQGRHLSGDVQLRLEQAIMQGPLREMYRSDLTPDDWTNIQNQTIWLRLAKLESSGLTLGSAALQRFRQLLDSNRDWRFRPHEREEFLFWSSGTGDPDYEENLEVDIAPRTRLKLAEWLKKPPLERRRFYKDNWREVCRTRFFHSLCALCDLARDGIWPTERWSEALYVWSENALALRSYHNVASIVQTMPDAVLQKILYGLAWWIEAVSKSICQHEDILLSLCRRVLACPHESGTDTTYNDELIDQPVSKAINHPIGLVTQALINRWFKRNPNDDDQLPADIKPIFTEICNVKMNCFRHGRVILAANLISLFRVDRVWTEEYLLPLFSWDNPCEAKAVWRGFLWSPRLYQPLIIALKPHLLETAKHYTDLSENRRQFAAFLTYAALGQTAGFTVDEFRAAIGALHLEGLEECALTLVQALEGAAEQREQYWKNRVQPFWQNIWPKSRDLASPQISESLSRLVISARDEFSAVLDAVQDWLQPIDFPYNLVHLLYESGLCKRFPVDALRLLNAVIADPQRIPRELGQCLLEIENATPQLTQNVQFQQLKEYSLRC